MLNSQGTDERRRVLPEGDRSRQGECTLDRQTYVRVVSPGRAVVVIRGCEKSRGGGEDVGGWVDIWAKVTFGTNRVSACA